MTNRLSRRGLLRCVAGSDCAWAAGLGRSKAGEQTQTPPGPGRRTDPARGQDLPDAPLPTSYECGEAPAALRHASTSRHDAFGRCCIQRSGNPYLAGRALSR